MSTTAFRAAAMVVSFLVAGSAMATPLPLAPGGSGQIPTYDGRTPTDTTLLGAACGYFNGSACATAPNLSAIESTALSVVSSSGGFIEAAGTTDLNPYGSSDLAFAFIFGGAAASSITSATVSSLGGYTAFVEACAPLFGSEFNGCASGPPGVATRSGATGDSIAFTQFPGVQLYDGVFPYTDGYVIYTNAPAGALVDPNNFSVDVNGSILSFAGLGLTPPSTTPPGVPEPSTLVLIGLGLLSLGVLRRRRCS